MRPAEVAPIAEGVPMTDAEVQAEITRLSKLNDLAYERERGTAAKKLGMRAPILDKLVAAERRSANAEQGNGAALKLREMEPWPEQVDGAATLNEINALVGRYIATSPSALVAATLWILHAHMIDAARISPRLAIKSAEKQCGKSTMLSVISRLVPRPLIASNITTAAVFRALDALHPTALIDEADTFLDDKNELRGVLNSGHNRITSLVWRIEGDKFELRPFNTWGALAIAKIGKLPGTLEDRSVAITLRRRLPSEKVAQLRMDKLEVFDAPAQRAARWASDNLERLRGADPALPHGLPDRAADNWRILIAIADLAGGGWPERARAAALEICEAGSEDRDSKKTLLLRDIRDAFTSKNVDRLSTEELLGYLNSLDARPWPEFHRGQRMTDSQLAKMVKDFGASSRSVRLPNPEGLSSVVLR